MRRRTASSKAGSRFTTSLFAIAGLTVMAWVTPGWVEADGLDCHPFEVTARDWKSGLDPSGERIVGMVRAGTRRLYGANDELMGLYTYSSTVVEILDDGQAIMNSSRTWTFEDGTISGVGMITHPDVSDAGVQPDLVRSIVTGGNGVFLRASGNIEMLAPSSDGSRLVKFDISCD